MADGALTRRELRARREREAGGAGPGDDVAPEYPGRSTASPRGPARAVGGGRVLVARFSALPAWARVLVVYAAARIVTTLLVVLSSALAPDDGRHGTAPSMLDYVAGWDGAWYREIALNGYPDEMPVDGSGTVQQNAWAFMPIFPWIARAIALVVPGAGVGSDDVWAVASAWAVCAAFVSLVAGFLACWGVYALLEGRIGSDSALWGAAFVAAGPLALMFQVAYAESLFLALVAWALVSISRERWWWLYPLILGMAFTRPGELALPLTVACYGIWRLAKRRERPVRRGEAAHILAIGAFGTAAGFAWPVVANTVTGDPTAYIDTELAWRQGWAPDVDGFMPGAGWPQAAAVWSGLWGIPQWAGLVILGVIGVLAVAMLLAPSADRLGIETRLWAISYLVYVALVVFPQSSVFRLLLPLAPFVAGALASIRLLRSTRILILVVGVVLQFCWIHAMYGVGNTYYLVP